MLLFTVFLLRFFQSGFGLRKGWVLPAAQVHAAEGPGLTYASGKLGGVESQCSEGLGWRV